MHPLRIAYAVLPLALVGCGSTLYQPGRNVALDPQDPREIDDEAIRQALEARPQMPDTFRVAYFNLAPEHDGAIEAMLDQVGHVEGFYRIPPLLVTGRRRFEHASAHAQAHAPAQPVSMRELRLLAARARCDVLVVFDYGYRITQTPNGWTALTPLIIPTLFVPFLDSEAESYLDAYVVDTRNGYLYAQLGESRSDRIDGMTIWDDDDEERVEAQLAHLLAATRESLRTVVAQGVDGETPAGQ